MKAILVIDMPNNCEECQFQGCAGRDLEILICSLEFRNVDAKEKPNWCPLKPLPKKDDGKLTEYCGDWGCGYADGWNTCLDKIMGETE